MKIAICIIAILFGLAVKAQLPTKFITFEEVKKMKSGTFIPPGTWFQTDEGIIKKSYSVSPNTLRICEETFSDYKKIYKAVTTNYETNIASSVKSSHEYYTALSKSIREGKSSLQEMINFTLNGKKYIVMIQTINAGVFGEYFIDLDILEVKSNQ